MPRYAAFLRGVTPMNARMPALRSSFEQAGFTAVKTVLSSGNVLFDAPRAAEVTLARKAEAAMDAVLGRRFATIVRPVEDLQALVEADPFAEFRLPAGAKRVVTFLREAPEARLDLPLERDGARILALRGREILTAYVPTGKGAAFMVLIEKTFGRDVTTRTWETVRKCAAG